VTDPKELKRIAARSKRAEVRSRLNRKRAKKEQEKKKEEQIPIEPANKKKDTVWKIIMPGKDRRTATYTE